MAIRDEPYTILDDANSPDFNLVSDVVTTGDLIAEEQWNSVYHSDEVPGFEDKVVKVFYRVSPEATKERIRQAGPVGFPFTSVGVTDLSAHSYEDRATVVVQDMSDYSVLDDCKHSMDCEEVGEVAVGLVDDLVASGVILDDFKLEEVHMYDGTPKYVDFEDAEAFNKFPHDYMTGAENQAIRDIENLYMEVAGHISLYTSLDPHDSKDLVAETSAHIDDKVYGEEGSLRSAVIDDILF